MIRQHFLVCLVPVYDIHFFSQKSSASWAEAISDLPRMKAAALQFGKTFWGDTSIVVAASVEFLQIDNRHILAQGVCRSPGLQEWLVGFWLVDINRLRYLLVN